MTARWLWNHYRAHPARTVGVFLVIVYSLLAAAVAVLRQAIAASPSLPESLLRLWTAGLLWVLLTLAIVEIARRFPLGVPVSGRGVALHAALALLATWLINGPFAAIEVLSGHVPFEDFVSRVWTLGAAHWPFNTAWALALIATTHWILSTAEPRPSPRFIPVRTGRRLLRLVPAEIVRIEADGDYVSIHTRAGRHHHSARLGELERILESRGFLRVHRSVIVNEAHVSEVRSDGAALRLLMTDGSLVSVSRRRRARVRQRLSSDGSRGSNGTP